MNKFLNKIKKISASFWILMVIVLVAVFLRTFEHSKWLRFNADQARDAGVVRNFLSGKEDLPLLGPKAGGTEFKLGGAFYYFQIASAAVFGVTPDKMAYPDLIAGILTIPLLYLLSKRYFNARISLILALTAAFSVFLVKYARFAWNPNSGPFYTLALIWGLILIVEQKRDWKNWVGVGLAGIALGIGVQLHTLLLVVMPIASVLFFAYVGLKNPQIWKKAALVIAIALALNVGQMISEYKTGGANIQAFFKGTQNKTGRESSLLRGLEQDVVCQVQANSYIVSGMGDGDQCGTKIITNTLKKSKGFTEKGLFIFGLIISILFTFGGVYFWIRAIKKEKQQEKKLLLQLMGIYALIAFLLLIPLAQEISLRFYLALAFVPFMLLGFWLEAIEKFFNQKRNLSLGIVTFIAILLVAFNASSISRIASDYANVKQINGATKTEITLGETEFIANYLLQNANPHSTVLVEGKQKYLFKYLKSIEYFTDSKKIKLRPLAKKTVVNQNLIVSIGNAKNKGKLTTKLSELYQAEDVAVYGRFSIAKLIVK